MATLFLIPIISSSEIFFAGLKILGEKNKNDNYRNLLSFLIQRMNVGKLKIAY